MMDILDKILATDLDIPSISNKLTVYKYQNQIKRSDRKYIHPSKQNSKIKQSYLSLAKK